MDDSKQLEAIDDRLFATRERRYSVYLRGVIGRVGSRNRMPLTVRNMSSRGLKGECAYPPPPDDQVEVELPGIGAVTGYVRWSDGIAVGISFEGPIDPMTAFTRNRSGIRRSGLLAAH